MMSIETQTTTEQAAAFWLTVPEIARELRIGTRSVYRAIHRRELRAAAINERGDLRVSRDWLTDWVERRA
jgi:excisionase family DNA binding protein